MEINLAYKGARRGGLILAILAGISLMFTPGCRPPPSSFMGRVIDAQTGRPLAGAWVEAAPTRGYPDTTRPDRPRVQTDDQGEFVIASLHSPPGRPYVLRATAEGYQNTQWARATIKSADPGQASRLEQPLRLIRNPAPPPSLPARVVNSLGMEFALIPAGAFIMGSTAGGDESPEHLVVISRPFYMQTTEVTQRQLYSLMGYQYSRFKTCGMNCPADKVPFPVAREFIQRLNAKEGGDRYGLPTEAQWEYACRAGGGGAWNWGDDEGELDQFAWFQQNSGGQTHPVAAKKPNAWGLYDMHGNVWEWCADAYDAEFYSRSPQTDPQAPGEDPKLARALRGGSWCLDSGYGRSAGRFHFDPVQNHQGYIGFRLVMSLP